MPRLQLAESDWVDPVANLVGLGADLATVAGEVQGPCPAHARRAADLAGVWLHRFDVACDDCWARWETDVELLALAALYSWGDSGNDNRVTVTPWSEHA